MPHLEHRSLKRGATLRGRGGSDGNTRLETANLTIEADKVVRTVATEHYLPLSSHCLTVSRLEFLLGLQDQRRRSKVTVTSRLRSYGHHVATITPALMQY